MWFIKSLNFAEAPVGFGQLQFSILLLPRQLNQKYNIELPNVAQILRRKDYTWQPKVPKGVKSTPIDERPGECLKIPMYSQYLSFLLPNYVCQTFSFTPFG